MKRTATIFGRTFIYEIANDGKWETIESKKHVHRHIFTIDAVTSDDGLTAWCLVVGKHKLSFAKIKQ